MAVDPATLLFPAGPLDPSLYWPNATPATVTTYMEAFIEDGVTRVASWDVVDRDTGTRLWAIYRAKDSVLQQALNTAASVSFVDEGSASILAEQLRMMQADRDAALTAFEELEADVTADTAGEYAVMKSYR